MNIPPAISMRPLHASAISASGLASVRNASDREHIGSLPSRIWDKIADFFCGTDREEAKKCLFDLYAPTTPDARKIELFFQLRDLAGAGCQDRFQHHVQGGRETFALLADGQDLDAGMILSRQAIDCDRARIEEVLNSDRSSEQLGDQLRKDLVRSGYEVDGQPIPDDDSLELGARKDLRLQLFDQALDQLGCTPQQMAAVHNLANQSIFSTIMQSARAPDPSQQAGWKAPQCPTTAEQITAYGIRRENGELRLQALCRKDAAAEPNAELRDDIMQMSQEADHIYRSLEIRLDLVIDEDGGARIGSLDYLGIKGPDSQ